MGTYDGLGMFETQVAVGSKDVQLATWSIDSGAVGEVHKGLNMHKDHWGQLVGDVGARLVGRLQEALERAKDDGASSTKTIGNQFG